MRRLLLSAALVVFLSMPAFSRVLICQPATMMTDKIAGVFGEAVIESKVHVAENGSEVTLELWVNEETGTWTVTGRDKTQMCAFSDGRSFGPIVHKNFRQFINRLEAKRRGIEL